MIFEDEIISIEPIGYMDLIDIEVDSNDHLFYANGILTHNSSVEAVEFDHSHIAGGISKINTADNVMAIFTSKAKRESGQYEIQFLKTRSAASVGHKAELAFDIDSLRIKDMDDMDYSDDVEKEATIVSTTTRADLNSLFAKYKKPDEDAK